MSKDKKNISEYSTYRVLSRWEKKKSWSHLSFVSKDPDLWFIEVIRYKKNSGEIQSISTIIEKDIETWEIFLKNDGWVKLTND